MRHNHTKDKVYELLKQNEGVFLSGEEMAERLFVSRAAIWKAIKTLRDQGVQIEAVTNRGYRIDVGIDPLNRESIEKALRLYDIDLPVHVYGSVDSTNEEAARLAGCGEEFVVVAGSQSKGRGRKGRAFFSPADSGLYMSLVLRKGFQLEKISELTGITASAVSDAIDSFFFEGRDVSGIKWVNDIYIEGKKVCGILSEAHLTVEDPDAGYVVVGIGINVRTPKEGFPKELTGIAGACISRNLEMEGGVRNSLTARVIERMYYYLKHPDESLALYRRKSILIGGYVRIDNAGQIRPDRRYARVLSISDAYRLEVEYDDGVRESLSSGEVSTAKY